MQKKAVLAFLFVLMFSCIICVSPDMALADNEGEVIRDTDFNRTFLSVQFSVSSNAHATGTVYRTTGLKIWVGPYYAFFDQADLTSKGFYSSSTSDTVDFTAADIANRSGASVAQIRAAANDVFNGINLGAQIKVLQNGVVKATIEEKEQVAPVFNQYGLGHCVAAAETRWGWAYDPQKPISYTLTVQIEGQGSTDPVGSEAPGTVHNNMSGTVELLATPIGGWQFAYWYDVLAGNSIATTPRHSITMNKNQTIRAVFIPDAATPPAVDPPPPEPPAPEPPPPPPPPPDYDPVADFDISNAAPVEGQTIQLRDDSTHPGAANGESIVSWEWTIEEQPGSSSQNVDVTWDTVGTYQVTLRVEDQDGDSDSCTKSVVVGPAMPAAVITLSSDSIMIGREFHVDGDESTAANGRDIKWEEMEWKFYGPDGSLKHAYTGRYPLGKGTPGERNLTNSVLNETGNWKVRLKVKDTNDYESEWAERIFSIYPDQPPIADFWLVSEALRNSYQGYELTIHDQSRPAAPDGALGDEIYLRDWTLYYDANNNGSYTDPEDETIHPGDTGKAAALIQVSDNDTNPRIKFNKTGRYKVELTVRERAEVWGEMTNGLTGDTSSKPALEKEITVINLAPTTAFEIQKKMPVDVQFAADYTVSDNKYNSLQSSQAGFIAALEAGGIDPVTGVQRLSSDLEITVSNSNLYGGTNYQNKFNGYALPDAKIGFYENRGNINGAIYSINLNTAEAQYIGGGSFPYPNPFSSDYFCYTTNPRPSIVPIKRPDGNYTLFYFRHWMIYGVYFGNSTTGEVTDITGQFNNFVANNKPDGYQMWIQTITRSGGMVVYDKQVLSENKTYVKVINFDSNLNLTGAGQFSFNDTFDKGEGACYFVYLDKNDPSHIIVSGDALYGYRTITYSFSASGVKIPETYDGENLYNIWHPMSKQQTNADFPSTLTTQSEPMDTTLYLYKNTPLFRSKYMSRPIETNLLGYYDQGHTSFLTHPWHCNPNGVAGVLFNPTTEEADIKFFNNSGVLIWQKPISDYGLITDKSDTGYNAHKGLPRYLFPFIAEDVFGTDTMILYGENTDGTGPCIVLVDSLTGEMLQKIPGFFLGVNKDNVLVIEIVDISHSRLKIYGRTQLKPLSEFIPLYPWDSNKDNFVTMLSDGNSFEDYSSAKDSLINQVNTNHINIAVISPTTGQTKTQANELIQNSEGGWWIQTAATMPGPLDQLAQKIIEQANQERGADNIVLVNQKVELSGNYSDPETDPAGTMRWEFTHDPTKLGAYSLCNSMGISSLNGAQMDLPPTAFDKAGTFQVRYRAKDIPVTSEEYMNDPKAGAKWSSSDAYLTVLVHRKPIAAFALSSTTINKTDELVITDNSYDPDLLNTDPEGKKGLRNWEWQYRNTSIGEEWIPCAVIPSSFTSEGVYAIRLRVRDAHGAWSNWTDQQLFNVLNNKPIAAFDALPNPVVVNSLCSLIDSSYDPDGDPLVNWEWTIQEIGTLNKVNPNPFPVSWSNVGEYLVTLRVQDSEDTWSDPVSQTVKVINHFLLTLESLSIQNGRGDAIATPGGNPPGPSGLNRVNAPVFPVNINSNEIGAYSPNQMVTLTAEPVSSGTYFLEWREGADVISTDTSCSISMTGNRTITAVFMKDPIFIPAVPPKIHVYIVK